MPVSSYGRSKLEGEKAVMAFKDELPFTIVRPPAVYGPRDKDFHILFRMVQRGFYPYWGRCLYSLLYIEDLIQGILLSAEKEEAEGKVFCLSDGFVYSNDDLLKEVSSALEVEAVKIRVPSSLMPLIAFLGEKITKKGIMNRDKIKELRHSNWTCDSSRAERELGFNPKITLREGIKWTADWYKIHRWL
jgi:nucleoside-diphosphate-sugar epimerase